MSSFPDKLKQLRSQKKVKQSDVSALLSISTRNYQRYEYGLNEPNIDGLILLADYFDVSLDYLVGRSDDPTVHK